MNNLEKLLKYLVKENDYKELSLKTGIEENTVKKFTMDIFARIVPNDFNKMEGSHIDEKDVLAIVNNFNEIIKEDNLRQLITVSIKKYSLSTKEISDLLGALLPLIHTNLKKIVSPKKAEAEKAQVKNEEKKEADEIYNNISSRANEDSEIEEAEDKAVKAKNKAVKAETKKEHSEKPGDEKLSKLEKTCIYIVLGALALLLVTFVVVLILM